MSTGTYEELLPCGGKLKVTKVKWEIYYYFPGPDMRYNGDSVTVQGSMIEKYISAFVENFEEYKQLKGTIPKGGEFSKTKFGMSIRIGGFNEGVCIASYHMPISSAQRLEQVISGYRYAAKRAPQIQEFLCSL